MKNNNFEKKPIIKKEYLGTLSLHHSNDFNKGYNSCLDKTNAPELLEALIEQANTLWHYEYNIAVKSGAMYEAAKKHADNYPKYLKLLALIKKATE